MEIRRILNQNPFFSICIPQYNRTSFLIEACKSFEQQTFTNFEVCISDDRSTDGREEELLEFLGKSQLSFTYKRQEQNKRYDGNLRASISLARGQFCLLMGNDDALASPGVLDQVYSEIQKSGSVGVAITNYKSVDSQRAYRRMQKTGILGKGYQVAVKNFRNFSFIGGVCLHTAKAKQHATDQWDGSEMYQMFLGCRIIAEGADLLSINETAVLQGIQIPGEKVDSYALKPRVSPCPIAERRIPLNLLGRLTADAIKPFIGQRQQREAAVSIFSQIFLFTYPFWIIEYRRIQSWNYAAGICLGMRPRNVLQGVSINFLQKMHLGTLYIIATLLGLTAPVSAFYGLFPALYLFAKKYKQEDQHGSD